MHEFNSLWPGQASIYAGEIDRLIAGFSALVVVLALPVFILMAYFAVIYRRGKTANRKHAPDHNMWVEISWSVIPFLLILGFYVWSTALFARLQDAPEDALVIDVVAKQWMWKFQHPGGQGEINTLHVPMGKPVKLVMASQDVVHSLYLPALRLKQDVVPGRYTSLWFTANKPGTYRLSCAEFCGTDHSVMGGRFIVMAEGDYAQWLARSNVDMSLAQKGEALFRSSGCSGCHGPASTVKAPDLAGLYGRPVPLSDGSMVQANDTYIRDSIYLPHRQVAAGYPDIMPTFQNVLGEEEVLQLVAYIKSLTNREGLAHE